MPMLKWSSDWTCASSGSADARSYGYSYMAFFGLGKPGVC
jgi:hypothetical protein